MNDERDPRRSNQPPGPPPRPGRPLPAPAPRPGAGPVRPGPPPSPPPNGNPAGGNPPPNGGPPNGGPPNGGPPNRNPAPGHRPPGGPPPGNPPNGNPPPSGNPPPNAGPPNGRPAPGGPPPRPLPQSPPPLLTHEESGVGHFGGNGGPGAQPQRPSERPTEAASAGLPPQRSGGGSGPPGRNDGRRPGSGGDGKPPRRTRRARIRRWLVGGLGVVILGPILLIAIGWLVFPVPSADDIAVTQVATFSFADGSPLATVRPDNVNRTSVTLDQVPQTVQHAVLSAEDRSFFSNPGFDVTGIGRAVVSQLTGGIGGGSTITQQYIKVTTGNDQYSLFRKFREVVLAAKISKEMTKEQILENYLNAIYLGRGAYGVQAASQAYFGKNVQDLSPSEGAMLAGLIQSPSRWDPAKNLQMSQQRWNFVLDGEVAQGWMSPAERAQQQFPHFLEGAAKTEGGIPGDNRGHIYQAARAELERLGISETEINTQGLNVTTTIDPKAQEDAGDAIRQYMRGQPDNLRSSLVSVNPQTGAVIAYYGGEDGVGLDYASVLKQPGSSFKPFVLAAALQAPNPIGLGTTYDGSSPQMLAGTEVTNSEGVSCGQCSVKDAMTKSINTVFYKMGLDVGPQKVADAAHQAGIPADLLPNPTGGISLGDREVHPEDMASAYATFAADGMHRDPFLVSKVTASDGRVIFDRGTTDSGKQVMDPEVARNVTESMTNVASSSRIPLNGGRPVAAKTGTVQSAVEGQNNDAWTVGFTPSVSTAVWVGTDDNSPIKNSAGRPVYGRMLPGSIWQSFMNDVLRGTDTEQFSGFEPIGQAPVQEVAGGGQDEQETPTTRAPQQTQEQQSGEGDQNNGDQNNGDRNGGDRNQDGDRNGGGDNSGDQNGGDQNRGGDSGENSGDQDGGGDQGRDRNSADDGGGEGGNRPGRSSDGEQN